MMCSKDAVTYGEVIDIGTRCSYFAGKFVAKNRARLHRCVKYLMNIGTTQTTRAHSQ